MPLQAPVKQRVLPPADTHPARCYQVIDLGTQEGEWEGSKKIARKVRLTWELPGTEHIFNPEVGPEPFSLGRNYTLTMGDKGCLKPVVIASRGAFRDDAEASRFNLEELLGTTVLLQVDHEPGKDGMSARITSVAKLPKAMTCPPARLAPVYYETAMGNNPVYKAFPEWLQKEIAKSPEYQKAVSGAAPF